MVGRALARLLWVIGKLKHRASACHVVERRPSRAVTETTSRVPKGRQCGLGVRRRSSIQLVVGSATSTHSRLIRLPPHTVAEYFVAWAVEHKLHGQWTVDEIWYLAEADFAEANDIELPPRRVFLGYLKKQPGVVSVRDRRIYGRDGRVLRKTTIYTLPAQQLLASLDQKVAA